MTDPIKIRWTGDARTKLATKYIESRLTSREDDTRERAQLAYDTLNRQQTNVVIEDIDEALALETYLKRAVLDGADGRVWSTELHLQAFERVHSELVSELEQRGWFIENESP